MSRSTGEMPIEAPLTAAMTMLALGPLSGWFKVCMPSNSAAWRVLLAGFRGNVGSFSGIGASVGHRQNWAVYTHSTL